MGSLISVTSIPAVLKKFLVETGKVDGGIFWPDERTDNKELREGVVYSLKMGHERNTVRLVGELIFAGCYV